MKRGLFFLKVGAVFLGSVLAQSACGTEPILRLAMLRIDPAPHRVIFEEPTASASRTIRRTLNNRMPGLSLQLSAADSTSRLLLLEKSSGRETRNPFSLGRHGASIQAGYGEIYSDKTAAIYGHNGTAWQEPGCGYVKIRFRF